MEAGAGTGAVSSAGGTVPDLGDILYIDEEDEETVSKDHYTEDDDDDDDHNDDGDDDDERHGQQAQHWCLFDQQSHNFCETNILQLLGVCRSLCYIACRAIIHT